MMADDWLNKLKNDYNYRQHWISSGTGVYSGSEAKDLKPARDLKSTAKLDVQEVDIQR